MIVLRLRWKREGAHYHCRLFTSFALQGTFAKSGDLVFGAQEWPGVFMAFQKIAEVLPEDEE